ncbi:hypothetical protein PINS_up000458 [Pythium insidiosum]|nr:hypothetical protein PINS_up000458 [Pythium insidiosum]
MSDNGKSPSPAKSPMSPREDADRSPRRPTSRSPSPRGREGNGAPPAAEGQSEPTNPGNNVYVANLAIRMGQPDLEELFGKFGRIERCEVILDPVTRESRGFAFVTFEDVRDAEDAVKEMNGKEIQGRRLRVEIAKRRQGHEKTPGRYLGPRMASTKYGRDDRGGMRDRRDRSRSRSRRRSRSRDRHPRRYDDRDRYDRRFDDRYDDRYDDRGRGRRSYDRYDDRRRR